MANLGLFFLGCCLTLSVDSQAIKESRACECIPPEGLMICEVTGAVQANAYGFTARGRIKGYADSSGAWKQVNARVLMSIRQDSAAAGVSVGDGLIIRGECRPVPGPANPDAFDYRKYLSNRQIFWQVNGDDHLVLKGRFAGAHPLMAWSGRSRAYIREKLEAGGVQGDQLALASALLLGTKDLLSREISNEFSNAGAMHVLCVSGLHVGIMYVIAERALFFLNTGRRGRNIRQFMVIAFIWIFALVTGLSASVVRAALMFSLLALGKTLRSSTINFNILATAAFIQLSINPYDMTQVGFQLSYLAVLGIFAFYKPLNNLVVSRNRVVAWAMPVMAVSMAAQLATAPLATHYFHKFPVYFLLTNMVVVPLAGVVLYLALLLLVVAICGVGATWVSFPLKWSLWLMHQSVERIQSIPGAVAGPIVMTATEVWLFYLIISGIFMFWVVKQRKGLFLSGFAMVILLFSWNIRSLERSGRNELVVYHVPGLPALDLISMSRVTCLTDSLSEDAISRISSRADPHRIRSGFKGMNWRELKNGQSDSLFLNDRGGFRLLFFQGKRIGLVTGEIPENDPLKKLELDLIVMSGRKKIVPGGLCKLFDFPLAVIDNSVPAYLEAVYLEGFSEAGIPCHSVRKQGAFLMSW